MTDPGLMLPTLLKSISDKLFRALWSEILILAGIGLIGLGIIWSLINVDSNQKATIANQQSLATVSNQVIHETLNQVRTTSDNLRVVSDDLVRLRDLYTAQKQDLEAQRQPISDIIRIETQLIANQQDMLARQDTALANQRTMIDEARNATAAAQRAVGAAYYAARLSKGTNKTIAEKVVTTAEKKDVEKQKAKLVTRTAATTAQTKKLDVLVKQYKKAIKKADHANP